MPDMTTDEMILALVATGKFTLPEGVERREATFGFLAGWNFDNGDGVGVGCDDQAHDLCAMHFAREMKSWTDKERAPALHRGFTLHMHDGDSAAAIKALYEAVCKEAKWPSRVTGAATRRSGGSAKARGR
jgi:hypothetical protein